MKSTGIHLAWIVVKDIEKAILFYTQVAGLDLKEYSKEYSWAELSGADGSILGICEENLSQSMVSGTNAVVTISVTDLNESIAHFVKNGAALIGEVIEVPGHVKMQTFTDPDGNTMQLVEQLSLTTPLSPGSVYKHYKGNQYKILHIVKHSESLEDQVVYQALYGEKGIWVRPLAMFLENVLVDGQAKPRFQLIK